jgi:hypothetical protein
MPPTHVVAERCFEKASDRSWWLEQASHGEQISKRQHSRFSCCRQTARLMIMPRLPLQFKIIARAQVNEQLTISARRLRSILNKLRPELGSLMDIL